MREDNVIWNAFWDFCIAEKKKNEEIDEERLAPMIAELVRNISTHLPDSAHVQWLNVQKKHLVVRCLYPAAYMQIAVNVEDSSEKHYDVNVEWHVKKEALSLVAGDIQSIKIPV